MEVGEVSSECGVQKLVLVTLSLAYTVDVALLCYAKSLQSSLTLCDPVDYSLPGRPVGSSPLTGDGAKPLALGAES